VVAIGIAPLVPALVHGAASLHNPGRGTDQLDFFIPFTRLSWTEVHAGHLPLWNPYSALGLPLWFNWQSGATSVPALVGYLVPMHFAYTAQMIVTLVIAGTGVYVLGTVLGLGALGSATAATLYELSGPFMGAVGWPVDGVLAWAGWLFAAAVLILRGRTRLGPIVLFALVLAASIYAGQPEANVMLMIMLAGFVLVLCVVRSAQSPGLRRIVRQLVDLAIACGLGLAVALPLVLPGLQVLRGSMTTVHTVTRYDGSLPVSSLVYGLNGPYYVGVITVALAVTGIAWVRRRTEAVAFGIIALATGLIACWSLAAAALTVVPYLGLVRWEWATVPMAFALALGAGIGMDALGSSAADPQIRRNGRFAFGAVAVLYVGLLGLAQAGVIDRHWGPIAAQRLIWPAAEVAAGFVVLALPGAWVLRRLKVPGWFESALPSIGGAVLLTVQAAFLASTDSPLWSSTTPVLTPPALAMAYQHAVGAALVGDPNRYCFPLSYSILEDENVEYGVHELAAYDPAIPRDYFDSWTESTGTAAGFQKSPPIYCPGITTARLARRYGVVYVPELWGHPGPLGAVLAKHILFEALYRIPDSGEATLGPLASGGELPPVDASSKVVAVAHPDPASWSLHTDATRPSVLRLHLTDMPGWHATIDGKPLALQRYAGVMLQARVPAGRHAVELHYWPDTLTVGLVVAGAAVIGMGASAVVVAVTRRRRAGHMNSR
jgi:hypothetical protein